MEKEYPAKQESLRIQAEYERRESEIDGDLYAPWRPGEMLMLSERKRVAASLLRRLGKFPERGSRCLEIGYGKIGWLADLISWGLLETDLHGIELDPRRALKAQDALPAADLKVGDATKLAWGDRFFDLVIVSTVFSSILDDEFRQLIATEIERVLKPDGAVVLYDIRVNNPRNKNLKRLGLREVNRLFSNFRYNARSLTLAPPISRPVARLSWVFATLLSGIPFLRTHRLTVLTKK